MLGDIASVATLILFVIYFIGRTAVIFSVKRLFEDKLTIEGREFDRRDYNIVESFYGENDGYNTFILTSAGQIYDLTVYELQYDDDFNETGRKKVFTHKFIGAGQSVEIITTIPELLPRYSVKYITSDYRKVSFPVMDNLKSGVLTEFVSPRHTLKSILYYLFR